MQIRLFKRRKPEDFHKKSNQWMGGCVPTRFDEKCWGVENYWGVNTGNLTYVAHTVCGAVLKFPYCLGNTKDWAENFEEVLEAVVQHPEEFSVRGFEYWYSEQEFHFLSALQTAILQIKQKGRPLTAEEQREIEFQVISTEKSKYGNYSDHKKDIKG